MAKKESIDSGVIQRISTGIKDTWNGWFGPSTPPTPIAPEETKGRAFDYPVGFNLTTKPRNYEAIGFQDLRNLSDSFDLLRLAIETKKDQISGLNFTVRYKDKKKKDDEVTKSIYDFMCNPSPDMDFNTFLRCCLEDVLVLDALAVYPRHTRGGSLYSIDLIDAATIKRVIDDSGRTPLPPETAYQQILKGIPAVNYSTDELLYFIKNRRTHKIYGLSPVEQIIMTVNIALNRQVHQLNYYTEGNIPEALISVPTEWTPEQVAQYQLYWDTMIQGDLAQKRHAKFVPGGMNIQTTTENPLKDDFDEWLSRIICYAFGLSPSALTSDNNRATAETNQDISKEEGVKPFVIFIESVFNRIISHCFARNDIEFKFEAEREQDPTLLANIHNIYLATGVKTVDEVRQELGLDPLDNSDYNDNTEEEDRMSEDELIDLVSEKVAKSIQVNVTSPEINFDPVINLPQIKVNTPDVKAGDVVVEVQPSQTFIKMQDDQKKEETRTKQKKVISKRNDDGSITSSIVEFYDEDNNE